MGRQREKEKKLEFKNKLPLLFLILIIIIGIIISLVGIYLVSQQKRVKELNYKKELTTLLYKTKDSLKDKVILELDEVFKSLSRLNKNNNDRYQILIEEIKKKTKINRYIKHPFLINSTGELLFPIREVPVLPLKETPDEVHYFKDARLLIPFKLNIEKSLFSNQTFFNIKAQDLYKKGLISEYRKNDYRIAIKYYKKAIRVNKQTNLSPLLFNGIGRCYYKSNNLKKSIGMYTMLLKRFGHLLRNDLEYLKIRIQRNLALFAIRQDDGSKAVKNYLSILEKILLKTKNRREIFVFFKNEAIDYLNHSLEKDFFKNVRIKFESLKKKEASFAHSLLDIELKRALSDIKEGDPKKRIKKINEIMKQLFPAYQERLFFYSSLKTIYDWEHQKDISINIIEPEIENIKKKHSLCFINLQKDHQVNDHVYFGFFFDQKKYNKNKILSDINKDLVQKGFMVQFDNDSKNSQFKYPLMSVQFKNFFHWESLVLYSDIDDFIGRNVRKQMWVNYTLIAFLILTFILFIFMFYKYISREAELLKLKSNFVDSVSHTLKTPLTRISLLAENVAGEWVKDEAKKKEFLNTIVSESYKMNDMINNMLSFSKIDAGKKQYDLKKNSLSEIVRSVIENYSEYIKKMGFKLDILIDHSIPDFKMDSEAIKLIIINLLQNAIKYSGQKKFIRISVIKEDDQVKIEVEDKGFGISLKEQKKIFEKYYRTQSKQVKSLEGSGLGLYLIKDAVMAHKGEIIVKSKLDEGSTFTIIFPL